MFWLSFVFVIALSKNFVATAGKYIWSIDISLKIWDLQLDSQIKFDYTVDMLLSDKQTTEDIAVEILAKSPYITGPKLLELVNKKRPDTTKQAMYFALSKLLEAETVAKAGGKYFLSQLWLQKLNRLFDLKKSVTEKRDAIFDLKDRESINYNFPTLLSCDTYWAHIYSILTDWIDSKCGIFMWEPHHWFIIGRSEVEREILKDYTHKKKRAFFAIAGSQLLDQQFKKEWRNEFIAVNIADKNAFAQNYYLHIFDDFIIEVYLDKELTKKIDEFYKNNTDLKQENKETFEQVVSVKAKVRMKISRNKSKSATLRRRLSKDFYIPEEIKI